MKEPVFDGEKFKTVWGRVSGQKKAPTPTKPPTPEKRRSAAVRFMPKM